MENNNGYRKIDLILDGSHCSCTICRRPLNNNCPNMDKTKNDETTCDFFKINMEVDDER